MRIVGYIENPKYKITIMHMNLRYALKFENEGIEQTYKIRESESISSVNDIKALIDESIIAAIDKQFREMEAIRVQILGKSLNLEDDYEEII